MAYLTRPIRAQTGWYFFAASEKRAIRQGFGALPISFDAKRQHRETFFEPNP
jgi:hypothetical protein